MAGATEVSFHHSLHVLHKFWFPLQTLLSLLSFLLLRSFFLHFGVLNLSHYAVLPCAWCEEFLFPCKQYQYHPSVIWHLQGATWNHTVHYLALLSPDPTGSHNHSHLQHQVSFMYNYCMWKTDSFHCIKAHRCQISHRDKISLDADVTASLIMEINSGTSIKRHTLSTAAVPFLTYNCNHSD